MARNKSFIPDRDAEIDGWLDNQINLTGYVAAKVTDEVWTRVLLAE